MKTLEIIDTILIGSGVKPRFVQAGAAEPATAIDADKLQKTVDSIKIAIEARRRTSTRVAYLTAGTYVVALCAYILAAWLCRHDQKVLLSILGVGGGGMVFLPLQLQRLWREMTTLDLLAAIIPSLAPSDAVETLRTLINKFS